MVNIGTLGCSRCKYKTSDWCVVEIDTTVSNLVASFSRLFPGGWLDPNMFSRGQIYI